MLRPVLAYQAEQKQEDKLLSTLRFLLFKMNQNLA